MESTTGQAANKAANASRDLRKAAQVLGDLSAAVNAQQKASKSISERVKGVEADHARQAASLELQMAGLTRAVEVLEERIAQATASLVVGSEESDAPSERGRTSPVGAERRGAAGGADAAERVREIVTLYEGLRNPVVTPKGNAPKAAGLSSFPFLLGAMEWQKGPMD